MSNIDNILDTNSLDSLDYIKYLEIIFLKYINSPNFKNILYKPSDSTNSITNSILRKPNKLDTFSTENIFNRKTRHLKFLKSLSEKDVIKPLTIPKKHSHKKFNKFISINPLIKIQNINNNNSTEERNTSNNTSSKAISLITSTKRRKRAFTSYKTKNMIKVKLFKDNNNNKNLLIKNKSPLDLVLEKKEYQIESKRNMNAFRIIFNNFHKKNNKFKRDEGQRQNYYYLKSKIKELTASAKRKTKDQKVGINFNLDEYKKLKKKSKNIKIKILKCTNNKNNNELKEEFNSINLEEKIFKKRKIAEMKEDIQDNKILLSPRNFLKENYKMFFHKFRMNKFVEDLNCRIAYIDRNYLSKIGYDIFNDSRSNDNCNIKNNNKDNQDKDSIKN